MAGILMTKILYWEKGFEARPILILIYVRARRLGFGNHECQPSHIQRHCVFGRERSSHVHQIKGYSGFAPHPNHLFSAPAPLKGISFHAEALKCFGNSAFSNEQGSSPLCSEGVYIFESLTMNYPYSHYPCPNPISTMDPKPHSTNVSNESKSGYIDYSMLTRSQEPFAQD
jgi:hypothetical protein